MGRIIVSTLSGKKGYVEISKRTTTIGRSAHNDIVLPDTEVSRSHAIITSSEDGNLLISDQKSTNGVYVNGKRINGEHPLVHRDVIRLGDCELLYEEHGSIAYPPYVHTEEQKAPSTSVGEHSSEAIAARARDGSIPATLGEYKIAEKLGEGVRGSVYKARDPLGRDVAIKLLSIESPNLVESLKREAVTLARLNHPNIIKVYRFGIDQGMPFLAMEYLPGQPLSRFVQEHPSLHLCEKLEITVRALDGLQYTHGQNVVHRDLKPQHIVVLENLDVKLIGFGIAHDMNSDGPETETAGTLPYMSPMHFVKKRTGWCDVFSMGVVLFELLTQTLPYASESDDLHAQRHKLMSSDPPPSLGKFMQECPAELESVVAKALSKTVGEGYATAVDFLEAILKVQETLKSRFLGELLQDIYLAASVKDYKTCQATLARIKRLDAATASKKQIEMLRADKGFQRFEHDCGS
jgi:serine/threonine protein kinase